MRLARGEWELEILFGRHAGWCLKASYEHWHEWYFGFATGWFFFWFERSRSTVMVTRFLEEIGPEGRKYIAGRLKEDEQA